MWPCLISGIGGKCASAIRALAMCFMVVTLLLEAACGGGGGGGGSTNAADGAVPVSYMLSVTGEWVRIFGLER